MERSMIKKWISEERLTKKLRYFCWILLFMLISLLVGVWMSLILVR